MLQLPRFELDSVPTYLCHTHTNHVHFWNAHFGCVFAICKSVSLHCAIDCYVECTLLQLHLLSLSLGKAKNALQVAGCAAHSHFFCVIATKDDSEIRSIRWTAWKRKHTYTRSCQTARQAEHSGRCWRTFGFGITAWFEFLHPKKTAEDRTLLFNLLVLVLSFILQIVP